jgi:MYXO-CTERM domain-containing protein
VWACTRNYGDASNPGDGFGIMKTTDLATWTGVLKYEDIQAPVSCAAGTVQKDTCETQRWCGVAQQLGITSTAIDCSVVTPDGPPPDAPTMMPTKKKDDGWCSSGSGGTTPLLVGLLVAGTLLRRRRTKEM